MVDAGLRVGLDRDRSGPDLLRTDARGVDRGLPVHAGGLGGVGVELVARDHPHAIVLPAVGGRRIAMIVVMVVMMMVVLVRMVVVVHVASRHSPADW